MKIPGFVDLQVNGLLEIDFSAADLTEEKFIFACEKLLAMGTAAFLPTVITSSPEVYEKNIPLIVKTMRRPEFMGRILGIHLEGPFISSEPGAVGAHNPQYVKKPDVEFLRQLVKLAEGNIKLLTIAAESEGAEELTQAAVKKGITVSLGHQMAQGKELSALAAAGAKTLTHLGNGMPNMVHRHNNTIWSALAEDRLSAMIITDGHHLPPALIKTIIKVKGVHNVIITSDASALAGCPPGRYNSMGNSVVIEESGLLHNPEKGCMVGSSATIFKCANYVASLNIVKPEDIAQMAFYNPLRLISIPVDFVKSKGNVEYDAQASQFKIC
ncbi:MAG: hypothetical protein A2017_17050 [Lentisphaerae bacterium GWF2_44_16]|nr:MAG: hypothetical protein A2017_17050 [Lentisphaerae bacterium GWF2_44_16]